MEKGKSASSKETSGKKIKKKFRIKWVPLIVAIVCLVGCYYLYQIFIELPITNIYIRGNTLLKDQEIIEIAKISDYPSFLKTFSSTIQKNLEESPYITTAHVVRKIWGQVLIQVEEAKPLFVDVDHLIVLSNQQKVEDNHHFSVAVLLNYTPDVKHEELVKQLSKLDSNVLEKISEIKYEPTAQDQDRFGLYMNDGNLAYVTLTKFRKMNYYNDIVQDVSCDRGIFNLDSGNHFESKEKVC